MRFFEKREMEKTLVTARRRRMRTAPVKSKWSFFQVLGNRIIFPVSLVMIICNCSLIIKSKNVVNMVNRK